MNISDEYKKLMNRQVPNSDLLVPLLQWVSGDKNNIEGVQKINKKFLQGNKNIYILEVTYSLSVRNFIKYPKNTKLDDLITKFYKDLAHYYGWSLRELYKNMDVIDIENSKEQIFNLYGYDKKERSKIKKVKL